MSDTATLPAMKTITLLSRATVASTAAFALALLSGTFVAATFAVAATSLLLLVAVRDYQAPARRWEPRLGRRTAPVGPALPKDSRFRLAA